MNESLVKNENDGAKLFEGNSWILSSKYELLEPAVEALEGKLRQAGWNEEEIPDLGLGFHEALVNAIKHGNKENPKKKIEVLIDIQNEALYIEIRDEGNGFNYKKVPDPTALENLHNTSGRGLLMIKKYFDLVEYGGNGNTMFLTKDRKNESMV